jgi:hypothetical protein
MLIGMEATVAYFKVLSRHSPEEAEGNAKYVSAADTSSI